MSTIKEAKKQAAEIVKSALDKRVDELKRTDAFKALKREIQDFQENGNYKYLSFSEDGSLVTSQSLFIPRELCEDTDGNADIELMEELLKECSDVIYFHQDCYSRGYDQWTMEQCLGDAVVYNESPERGCYAIHSDDLKLKIDKVNNEEHGYLLIEQAMRKHGYYPDVVTADYHGNVSLLSIPKDVRNATDAELVARIDAIENEKDEE